MHLRVLPLLVALLLGFSLSASADLEIKKARYGNTSSYRDVSDVIAAYLRHNTLSFPVNARSMGGDPSPRTADYLFIVYRVGGREFTDTVAEGGVFTFQGVPNVEPARPLLNLRFLPPATPLTAPLLVINRSGSNIQLYCVDRYGQWVWVGDMITGQTLTMSAQVRQEWLAVDPSSRTLARTRISRGDNTLWIDQPGIRAPLAGYRGGEASVRFENTYYRPRYLYNLDSQGRWNWMATIESGGGYSASTEIGQTWIVTDTSNRVVRQITVAPGLSHVKLN